MQILPTISIVLDSRRAKKNGRYPVKLRVTFLREQRYYPTQLDLTKTELSYVLNADRIPKDLSTVQKREIKEWKLAIDAITVKANDHIKQLKEFSFAAFERLLFGTSKKATDVYSLYNVVIEKQKADGAVGTASNYTCSMNSLKRFSPKLQFRDITVELLKDYERWLLAQKKSITTVGVYLRPLRAIINIAIEEGMASQESNYPFGKRKYQIPASRNVKKALTLEEIGLLFNYNALEGTWWEKARDFFIFSYLANGMNIKDIALLKHSDIDGEFIRFIRAKTKNTNRSSNTFISIHITEPLRKIIERWKTRSNDKDDYLFPVIQRDDSPEKQRKVIQQFTKMINTYIDKIAVQVGITKKVTTYYARHSFATVLLRKGHSTEIISESLGHSSLQTTKAYLGSFEDSTKKKIGNALLDF